MPRPLKVFLSYDPRDAALKDSLLDHLGVIQRFHNVKVWATDEIDAGAKRREAIAKELARSDVALLLLNARLLASHSLNDTEMSALLKQNADTGLLVIPVILRSCAWRSHPALEPFQVLPRDEKPIGSYTGDKRANALAKLAEEIGKLARKRPKRRRAQGRAGERMTLAVVVNRTYDDKTVASTREDLRRMLADLLQIPLNEIEVKRMRRGSIKVQIELPKTAADQLLRSLRKGDESLERALKENLIVDVQAYHPFGHELRRRRIQAGMTLEELADAARLTANYIGTIENGRRDPSLSTITALARALHINPGEFFGGRNGLSPGAVEAGMLLDESPREARDAVLCILRAAAR